MNPDLLLPFFAVAVLAILVAAMVQNARARAASRATVARMEAAAGAGEAAAREAMENQRRMIALLEEMNATLRRIEAAQGGDPLSR